MYYGIYVNGVLDCDPCPMIFESHEEASAALANIDYDATDEIEIDWVPDVIAESLMEDIE